MVQKEKSRNNNCETRQKKTNSVVSRTLPFYGPTHVPGDLKCYFKSHFPSEANLCGIKDC